jgi:hypothetical protein
MLLHELTKPLFENIKNHPEWDAIVTRAIIGSGRFFFYNIKAGVEQRVISPKSVVDAITTLTNDDYYIVDGFYLAASFTECFTDSEWQTLQEKAREYFKKKESASAFYSLEAAKVILNQDEIKSITLDFLSTFPNYAASLLDTVESVLGPNSVEEWIRHQLGESSEIQLFSSMNVEDILKKFIHNEELKRRFITRLVDVRPGNAIQVLSDVAEVYEAHELSAVIQHIIEHTSAHQLKRYLHDWRELLHLSEQDTVTQISTKLQHLPQKVASTEDLLLEKRVTSSG